MYYSYILLCEARGRFLLVLSCRYVGFELQNVFSFSNPACSNYAACPCQTLLQKLLDLFIFQSSHFSEAHERRQLHYQHRLWVCVCRKCRVARLIALQREPWQLIDKAIRVNAEATRLVETPLQPASLPPERIQGFSV